MRDAKTGSRMVVLTPPVAMVLDGIARVRGNPWVIPGDKPGRHLSTLGAYWRWVRERAEVPDVRIHDLRHSASRRGRWRWGRT